MDLFHVLLGELPSAEKAPCLRLFPDGSLLSRTGPHRGIKAESHPSNWDNSEGTSQLQSSQKNGTKVFVVIASKVFSAYFTSGRTGMIPRALPTKLPGHKFPPHSLFCLHHWLDVGRQRAPQGYPFCYWWFQVLSPYPSFNSPRSINSLV